MKRKPADVSWLPPAEEWDFRSVTVKECRVACHWEYERENIPDKTIQSGTTQRYCPPIYRRAARELFPRAWTTLTKEQQETVLETFLPTPVIQVRKLGEFFKRMPMSGNNPAILESFLHHSYVIVPHFRLHGVELVIKELEKWARREAKQYPQSRRAQAAAPPFDALKWLAVVRLDKARSRAHISINEARDCVAAFQRLHRLPNPHNVFPVYASDGAWLKAKNNSHDCKSKSAKNPSFFLAALA